MLPRHLVRSWRDQLPLSWRDVVVALLPLTLVAAASIWAVLHFVRPAAPRVVTISSGPDGSTFQRSADRYAKAFARSGVTLRIVPSNGSRENLERLADPASDVDVGFVQVGVKLPVPELGPVGRRRELVSLGTIARQPLYVLVRGSAPPPTRLSELAGRRLVVGPEGSGTRVLALRLLQANGIEPEGATALLDLDDDLVGDALEHGTVDAAFLMGDSASPRVIRSIMQRPGVHVMQLSQLDAYLRRFQDLDRIVIPMGAYDLAKNLPAADLDLLASSVEMVARADLHPAISDLLLETMHEAHGRPFLLQRAGEFPAAREHDLPLGADARRYYQSGKRWLYKVLPFWIASLVDRFLVILLPLVLLALPVVRAVPNVYEWRIRRRLYRIYGALLDLERDAVGRRAEPAALLERLESLERRAESLTLPLSYANELYVLREHIMMVRERVGARAVVRAGARSGGA